MSQTIKDVQNKILEIMKYIDGICRENNIEYYIMGGTALGAVRHGGFIPWDDDLDIFMKPAEYEKFKEIFESEQSERFVLQEWKITEQYLEYAKIRMNGTTFIEKNLKHRKDLHHGIYVDIMILHKIPKNRLIQRIVYFESKFVTLYALSQRNWEPKTNLQYILLRSIEFLPCDFLARKFYKRIYKYDGLIENYKYSYWITPAKFRNGLFDSSFFEKYTDIKFEDTVLLGSKKIKEYLSYRYGDYMKLPDETSRKSSIHSAVFDVDKDYKIYMGEE